MTAPYTLLVGDQTIHLLSKYAADASVIIGARVKEGEFEVTTQSLVSAQRERALHREQEQQQAGSPQASSSSLDSSSATQTPTKAKSPPPSSTPSGPAVRDFWGLIGIINLHQGADILMQ